MKSTGSKPRNRIWPKSVGAPIATFVAVIPGLVLCLAALVASAPSGGSLRAAGVTQQPSAGVWDATPYVKRDFDPASVNGLMIRGTDDAPNISRALADMVQAGCTTLYLPSGRYRINSPIALPVGLPALNLRIVGAGANPLPYSRAPVWAVSTLLAATNGNAIFDWDGAFNCTWESMEFGGYTNLARDNPRPPPWLIRLRQSGTGGTSSHNTFRRCGFAYAAEGVRYGVAGQNNNDQILFDDCCFFGMPVAYHQANDQSLDGVMYRCTATNVGTIAWIERGGHFVVDGMMELHACGDGLPAPVYGDPSYAAGSHKYWVFDLGAGGPNAASVTIRAVRGEAGTGQWIRSAGQHIILIENLDDTAGDANRPLFSIVDDRLTIKSGRLNMTAGSALGSIGAFGFVTLEDIDFAAALPGATSGTTVTNLMRCRYWNGAGYSNAPGSL